MESAAAMNDCCTWRGARELPEMPDAANGKR